MSKVFGNGSSIEFKENKPHVKMLLKGHYLYGQKKVCFHIIYLNNSHHFSIVMRQYINFKNDVSVKFFFNVKEFIFLSIIYNLKLLENILGKKSINKKKFLFLFLSDDRI